MQKIIISISEILGFTILVANNVKDTNPISMAVLTLISTMISNFFATLQDLYSCSCFFLQSLSHFSMSAWNKCHWSNAAVVPSELPSLHDGDRAKSSITTLLMEGDVEVVMENLGIPWDARSSGTEVDVSDLFGESERIKVEEMKEAFELFDGDRDGYIDAKDLKKILCGLGFLEFSERECHKMIVALNTNSRNVGNSGIDFGNFVKIIEGSIS